MWSRLRPALSLFFLSPLIAEYLLGSLPLSMITLLPIMALMYGAGAVIIRELVRRSGRGWPSIVLLATAFGLIEEGLVTQSLFNPNYLHLRLLDYGYLPELGTSFVWLIYVVSLHVFWSISVPIGLTESVFRTQRDKPWLGRIGLTVFGVLYVAGCSLIGLFTYKSLPFMASPWQLGAIAAIAAALSVAAFAWPRSTPGSGKTPHSALLFLVPLAAGSALVGTEQLGKDFVQLPWFLPAGLMLIAEAAMLTFMVVFTRGRTWTDTQRWALMAGGLAVYVWLGFPLDAELHGAADLVAHSVLAAAVVVIAALAWLRIRLTKVL